MAHVKDTYGFQLWFPKIERTDPDGPHQKGTEGPENGKSVEVVVHPETQRRRPSIQERFYPYMDDNKEAC